MKVLKNQMKSRINDNIGLTETPACPPNAVVNIPPIKERITNNNAAITLPISIPIVNFPTNCRHVRLLGSLKKSDWPTMIQ
jgi:hypothetical protein